MVIPAGYTEEEVERAQIAALAKIRELKPEICVAGVCKSTPCWCMREVICAALSTLPTREAMRAEIERLTGLVYVPGMRKCAKCDCVLITTNLHAGTGRFSANNEPQQCPNDCGPMWPVTERDAGDKLIDDIERMHERAEAAERKLAEAHRQAASDAALIERLKRDYSDACGSVVALNNALAELREAARGLDADASLQSVAGWYPSLKRLRATLAPSPEENGG